jgi:predicted nucleic acid-binding protein
MNGNSYLLDTNVAISALNQRLVLPNANYYVSVITEIELLSFPAISANDEYQIKQFLKDINVVELSCEIKKETIILRRQKILKLPDAIICATAITTHAILVTADTRLHNVNQCKAMQLPELLHGRHH